MNKMTKEDIEYRQGRSKKQVQENEKVSFVSCMGLLLVLVGIIIYGLLK
jgi:hypothetical protein|tara:strand:+ start:166 stop:312 length:147 start_codon:yes stop_codon:yes gene_type:complete